MPTVYLYDIGDSEGEERFRFACPEFPEILTPDVQWAAWDCLDQLLVARAGCIERWARDDFVRGTPSFTTDLNGLRPPSTPDTTA